MSLVIVEKTITRHFVLDRTKTREQIIDALGRKKRVNAEVLATMPLDGPDEGDLIFFPLKRWVPKIEYAAQLDSWWLKAHPLAQIQVNIDDPFFANKYPNCSQWGQNGEEAAYLWIAQWYSLGLHCDERQVRVSRSGGDFHDDFWLGCGVSK